MSFYKKLNDIDTCIQKSDIFLSLYKNNYPLIN